MWRKDIHNDRARFYTWVILAFLFPLILLLLSTVFALRGSTIALVACLVPMAISVIMFILYGVRVSKKIGTSSWF